MSKKPTLTVVAPDFTIPTPPLKLGSAGLSLWNRIQREYEISDAGGVELLCQICCAADTIEALSEQIAVDGQWSARATGSPVRTQLLETYSIIAVLLVARCGSSA